MVEGLQLVHSVVFNPGSHKNRRWRYWQMTLQLRNSALSINSNYIFLYHHQNIFASTHWPVSSLLQFPEGYKPSTATKPWQVPCEYYIIYMLEILIPLWNSSRFLCCICFKFPDILLWALFGRNSQLLYNHVARLDYFLIVVLKWKPGRQFYGLCRQLPT